MSKLRYVNLGCGDYHRSDWINIDFISNSPEVIQHNLLAGIPLPDASADLVYHSHVLEHFPKKYGVEFLADCYRVLAPGGTIRIAIPDFEAIIANYTRITDGLRANSMSERLWAEYDWTMMEVYDQTVRNISGGEMGKYLTSGNVTNKDYILSRSGREAENIIDNFAQYAVYQKKEKKENFSLAKEIYRLIRYGKRRERLLKILLGDEYEKLKIGRFRLGGEIHQWMYDKYSLERILEEQGFVKFQVRTAFESYIPNWASFELDGKDGKTRKPDSLFVEATKPSS